MFFDLAVPLLVYFIPSLDNNFRLVLCIYLPQKQATAQLSDWLTSPDNRTEEMRNNSEERQFPFDYTTTMRNKTLFIYTKKMK